jgi:hypothetical protein
MMEERNPSRNDDVADENGYSKKISFTNRRQK